MVPPEHTSNVVTDSLLGCRNVTRDDSNTFQTICRLFTHHPPS